MEGISVPQKRSDRVVLEANMDYWDTTRLPRLQRIVFDNTITQKDAVELVKTVEGRVDLVTELRPLETLRVASSAFATVVKTRGNLGMVFGRFNMRKAASPWTNLRLRHAVNYAINFLYSPIQLYAVNEAVEFVPYVSTVLNLAETAVTAQHWSVQKQKAVVQE